MGVEGYKVNYCYTTQKRLLSRFKGENPMGPVNMRFPTKPICPVPTSFRPGFLISCEVLSSSSSSNKFLSRCNPSLRFLDGACFCPTGRGSEDWLIRSTSGLSEIICFCPFLVSPFTAAFAGACFASLLGCFVIGDFNCFGDVFVLAPCPSFPVLLTSFNSSSELIDESSSSVVRFRKGVIENDDLSPGSVENGFC